MERRNSFVMIALTLVMALVGGVLGGVLTVNYWTKPATSPEQEAQNSVRQQVVEEESTVIDTVKRVSPSVVSVVISKDLPLYRQGSLNLNDFFNNDPFFNFGVPFQAPQPDRDSQGNVRTEKRKVGGGSGFIVSEDGLVVTNRHVVQDPDASYTVILNDQTEYNAEVLSRDNINDIAVLRLKDADGNDVKGLKAASLGDSDKIQVGQRVIAIGNALAEYENTVTVGVISAKGRSIAAGSINSTENLVNLIQTDAAINPGNSGGPLVNLEGEVIGINTAIAANAQGIGFAISINDVKNVIQSVKEHGKIVRPYLGVRFMVLDEVKAKELQIDVKGGALLTGDEAKGEFAVVPGSPAEKAGLKIKDVILEVDGEQITPEQPLHVLISQKKPGDTITLSVWRSGETIEVKVKLEEAK
ncbi:MAG: trypsin-like peptidase domain-containing protein [Candidatus Peregrinibacteria bacterium]